VLVSVISAGRSTVLEHSRGVRRTAKTLMARAGVRPDISERVLAHVIPGVEGIYDRYEYLAEKRHALERLASLIDSIVNLHDNILPLAGYCQTELWVVPRSIEPTSPMQLGKLDVHQAHQRHSCKTAPTARQSRQILSGASQNCAVGVVTKKDTWLSSDCFCNPNGHGPSPSDAFPGESCLQRRIGLSTRRGSLNIKRGEL